MRRLLAIPMAPAMLAVLAMTTLAARGDGNDTSAARSQSSTENLGIDDARSPAVSTRTPSTSVGAVLEDGRHPVYLTDIDLPAGTITLDLVQFLTGDEAKRVYAEDYPGDPSGPANDYYIVNDNSRLRTLPVVPGVDVTVVWLEPGRLGPQTISFEELPDYFAEYPATNDPHLWYDPFWLTVDDGRVVAIEEQYLP